jgi:hypothetical protein
MPSEVLKEDWHLLIDDNGDPYGPAKLRELARQAAHTYYTDRGGADLDERRRVFTLYASQLSKRAPNYDFGVSYLTCADTWPKVQIASTVARYVSKLGKWPTRATAIEHLEKEAKDPLLLNHLRLIDTAAEDAANQTAGMVEAGTEVGWTMRGKML